MTHWYNKTSKCQHSRNRQVITHIHSHADTCVSTGKTHVQTHKQTLAVSHRTLSCCLHYWAVTGMGMQTPAGFKEINHSVAV